jgi:enterochelin esterase-like enzyme
VNLMMLLAVAVVLNDQYTFYADWTDLGGGLFGPEQVTSARAGASATEAANAMLAGHPASDRGAALPPPVPSLPPGAHRGDRVLKYTVAGPRSGLRGTVLVTLPEGYTSPANAARRYPVLEAFHGLPGGPSQWVDSMGLGQAADTVARRGEAAEMITVSPTHAFPPGVDTECVDGVGSAPKVETWLTQDVPDWVTRTFRVRADRSSWSTIGLSMGAWCAAMATMLHPEQYAAAIVMGGYFAPEFSDSYVPFKPGTPQARRYDLINLARTAPPPVALWAETSQADEGSYPSTSRLLAAVRAPMSMEVLALSHAGHRVSLWAGEVPEALDWLGHNVSGFAPQ